MRNVIELLLRYKVLTMWMLWCLLSFLINLNGTEAIELQSSLRPSQQKCQEYIQEIKNRQRIKDQRKASILRRNRHNKSRKNKIFGVYRGNLTRASEYPHMGALGWYSLKEQDWVFQCGASLISTQFLLTAAHCTKISRRFVVDFDTLEPKIVRLGARNIRRSNKEIPHDFDINQIIVHPQYMSPYNYYDIALLKVSREINFTRFIHPACLETSLFDKTTKSQKYTVTGWGIVANAGKMVDELRFGEVDLIDQTKCDFYIRPFRSRNWNRRAPHQICAGKLDGSVDTCNGDSGGPLQYKLFNTKDEGSMHAIIGITAFGSSKCATKNLPSIYTKVSYFIPWIENTVWPKETRIHYNINASKRRGSLRRRHHFKNNF